MSVTQKVRITQVFRVERTSVIDVEATSHAEAVGIQEEEDAPAYDDPRWVETRTLEYEEVV